MVKEVVLERRTKPVEKDSKYIRPGTTFTGRIGDYEDRLFARTYNEVVSLENPHKVWSSTWPIIHDYQEVDIRIEVLGPAS